MLHLTKSKVAVIWAAILLVGVVAGWSGYRSERARILVDLIDDVNRCAVAFEPAEMRQLAGARTDLGLPVYAMVKSRLGKLHTVNPQVRFVYIFRFVPETGKVIYLADSALPGAKDESLPGDDYPQAPQSPGLQEIIRTGLPTTEGPLADDFGTWVTGYAVVSETPSGKPGVPIKEIVGMDLDAGAWSRMLWLAGFQRAFYVWVLLGLPFAAFRVMRRQLDQREAIRNLSEAMEQSHSALLIVDLGSRIEYANRGLCRQIGYSRRELIGRQWRDFQVAETLPEKLAELVSTVRSGHPWEGEWFNRRKDGTVYPVRGIVTPVKNRSGAISCFVAVFDDTTETKRTEADLREARDQAQAADRAKGQFLATMSHEVRTPLNGIVGFTSLLLDTSLTPEQREYVQTIRTGGEALIQLTGDILDFARIETGRLPLELLPCDPGDCVEEALDLLAGRAAEKNIELLHGVEDSVPTEVLADGGRLRQVLVNLVGNAVKFTEAGEVEVTVRALPPTQEVRDRSPQPGEAGGKEGAASDLITLEFSIRDTGIGIAADQHEKLFKPFTQLDASSTRKFGGTGLGLAISRNLARLMDGEISLVSEPGRGSTFTFFVRVPAVSTTEPPSDLNGLRVALVAPPGALRREIARLATRWHAQLIEVETASELAGKTWDTGLVVLDETSARALALVAPSAVLPAARTFALVPVTLPTEVRTALRAHFRLLVSKPVHHHALCSLLSGVQHAPVLAAPPLTHFGLHVLVVEDNPVNQRLTQRFLSNLGCKWTITENGRRAVEELARETTAYDLVLMDLHMPELDGVAALEEIRAGRAGSRAQTLWVAALTADAREAQKRRVMSAGANDYLTKPLKVAELEAALRRFRAARGTEKK